MKRTNAVAQSISDVTIQEIVGIIRKRTAQKPQVVIVTGSGLAGLGDAVTSADVIPYSEIPGWPQSTVEGHPGELVFGKLEGQSVVVQRGRAHFYEGYTLGQVTLPMRVFRALGAETVILTNAAGGVNPDWQAGDLMLITDHIGLPGMAGNNPLFGPNNSELGPRFPVMAGAYDYELGQKAQAVAQQLGFTLRRESIAGSPGPRSRHPPRFALSVRSAVMRSACPLVPR